MLVTFEPLLRFYFYKMLEVRIKFPVQSWSLNLYIELINWTWIFILSFFMYIELYIELECQPGHVSVSYTSSLAIEPGLWTWTICLNIVLVTLVYYIRLCQWKHKCETSLVWGKAELGKNVASLFPIESEVLDCQCILKFIVCQWTY